MICSTPFGLYRDGTELRGVYYSKPGVARAACMSLGDACDYPILMGNDPLYGGTSARSVFYVHMLKFCQVWEESLRRWHVADVITPDLTLDAV